MKRFTGPSLILLFTGCTLFRPLLQSRLAPMDMTAVPGGTFEMGNIIEKENELLQANRTE